MTSQSITNCAQEVLINIFENLEPADLCSVSLVCMSWHRVADDKYLWRKFLPESKEGTKSMYIQFIRDEMKRNKDSPDLTWLKDESYMGSFVADEAFPSDVRKVIVTGDVGVGKTSFIRVATGQSFALNYRSTIGIDFGLAVRPEGRIQLWDIAGPERFGNLTRVYYKCSHMVMLAFDMSRPNTIDGMLRFYKNCIINLETSEWPVKYIVCGCKWDLVPDWGEEEWEDVKQRCYAVVGEGNENEIVAFIPMSAKQNLNIKKAIDIMYETLFSPGSPYIPPYRGQLHLPDRRTWKRMSNGIHSTVVESNETATTAASSSWCCIA